MVPNLVEIRLLEIPWWGPRSISQSCLSKMSNMTAPAASSAIQSLPDPEPKASLKMLPLQGRLRLTHSSTFPIVLAVQPDTGVISTWNHVFGFEGVIYGKSGGCPCKVESKLRLGQSDDWWFQACLLTLQYCFFKMGAVEIYSWIDTHFPCKFKIYTYCRKEVYSYLWLQSCTLILWV